MDRKEELKARSEERSAHWKDTLAAKRRQRLLWKSTKAEEDEERRRAIDRKEALSLAQQREETIRRAQAQLYEENGKVRAFRSQQLYVDVIAERGRQLAEKKDLADRSAEEEVRWHNEAMAKMEREERQEAEKARLDREHARRSGEEQRRQRTTAQAECSRALELKLAEELMVIEEIKLRDQLSKEQATKESNERRRRARAEIDQIAIAAKENKECRRRQEEADSREREAQLETMVRFVNARSEVEKEHFDEKQKVRRHLQDRACSDLKERAAREVELFLKHQRAHAAKEEARQQEEARTKKELQETIQKSREEQIERRRREKEEERKTSASLIAYSIKMNELKVQEEVAAKLEKRRKNVELYEMQKKQIEENRLQRTQLERGRLELEKAAIESARVEDDVFLKFAEAEIARFRERGKDTALLERAVHR